MNRTATLASCLLAACSATIDPSQIHCRDNSECGTGSYCTPSGTCATTPVDCPLPSVKIGDACKYPPAAPTGVTATSSANVSLQWSTAADAASWVVQRAAAAAGPFSLEFAATTNSYVDTTVAPGTAVWYQIVAVDTSNIRSAPSAVVAGLTLPAAPQGFTATGQLNSVHLSWTAVAGADTYTLLRGPAGSATTAATGLTAAGYTDSSLAAGTSFRYQVQAVNATGAGPFSSAASALTLPAAPASPLAALDSGKTSIVFTWNRSTGATSYDVFRGTAAGSETVYQQGIADPTSGTTATFTDAAPDRGLADYYKVTAKNASGSSALSLEASALTIPAAPASVNASANGNGGVAVVWTASAGATGYVVTRDGTDLSGTLAITPLSYTDATTAAGGTYAYAVYAINGTGNGTLSSAQPVTLSPSAPTLSTSSLFSSGANTTINLTWTLVPGATAYNLFRGTSPTTLMQVQTIADPTNSFADQETVAAQTIYFNLVATNAGGSSPASAPNLSVVTVPATPTNFTIDGPPATNSVSMSWDAMPTAAGYKLSRAQVGSLTALFTVPAPVSGGRVPYVDSTAQPSAIYTYAVSAVDSTGSLVSDPAASTPGTATTPTPIPANVAASAVDDTHITVSWDRASSANSYDVLRGTTAGAETFLHNVADPGSGTRASYIDATAVANTNYFYKVVAKHTASPAQSSLASAEVSALTLFPAPTGLSITGTNDFSATLNWTSDAGTNPDAGPLTFDVLRSLSDAGQYLVADNVPETLPDGGPNLQTFVDDGPAAQGLTLVQNATYYWRVRVHDPVTNNLSLPSNEAAATTTNAGAPFFIGNVVNPTTVSLSVPSRFAGYDIYDFYRSSSLTPPTSGTAPTVTVNSISGAVTATDVVAAGTYNYWGLARWSGSAAAVTPWSSSPTNLTVPPAPPSAPANPKVLAAGAGEVLLSWLGDSTATSYTIVRTDIPSSPFTSTTSSFTDKTVAVGSSYTYNITANNAGGPSSLTPVSTPVVASAATSFVCSPARTTSFYSDSNTVTQPLSLPINVIPAGAGPIAVKGLSDGNCLITGLPASGIIVVKRGPHHIYTTGRSMDLSNETYGRATSTSYLAFTPVSFTIGNLTPWTASSHVELFASNVAAVGSALEQSAIAGLPAAGATSLSNFTVDANAWSSFGLGFIDTNSSDKPVLIEMSPQTSSNGFPYLAVSKVLNNPAMSSVDGRPLSISGTFGPPLGSSSTAFKYLRSQFKAIAPSVNPAAVGTVNDSIIITGAAKDFGGTPRVFAGGGGADIVNIFFDTATTDVDMGTILIPNPYPTWYSGISVNVGFNTPVNCGTGKTPAIFGSGSAVIDSLSSVLTQASGGGIAPTLPPVLNPQIAPTGTGTFVDLFHDRTGVGLNPTLQWTIQGGLALQPSYIRVFLNTVAPDATNTCVVTFSIAQLYTAGNVTSMTLPTGLLQNGVIYFATIRPTYEPARNILTKPFIRGSQEYFTETVTNTFTP